jgi:uncharacterized membrane protein
VFNVINKNAANYSVNIDLIIHEDFKICSSFVGQRTQINLEKKVKSNSVAQKSKEYVSLPTYTGKVAK